MSVVIHPLNERFPRRRTGIEFVWFNAIWRSVLIVHLASSDDGKDIGFTDILCAR